MLGKYLFAFEGQQWQKQYLDNGKKNKRKHSVSEVWANASASSCLVYESNGWTADIPAVRQLYFPSRRLPKYFTTNLCGLLFKLFNRKQHLFCPSRKTPVRLLSWQTLLSHYSWSSPSLFTFSAGVLAHWEVQELVRWDMWYLDYGRPTPGFFKAPCWGGLRQCQLLWDPERGPQWDLRRRPAAANPADNAGG